MQQTCAHSENTRVYAHSSSWSGQPLTLGCSLELISSGTDICLCSEQQLVCQVFWNVQNLHLTSSLGFSAKRIFVCSQQKLLGQPSVDLFRKTCVCVCAHSNNRSAKVSIDLFCARLMCIQKHTSVRPQPQLVGQPLPLGCNPQLILLPKLLNVQNDRVTLSLDILQHTCVCSQQQLAGQPSVDFFCNACVYVLTVTIGLPKVLS